MNNASSRRRATSSEASGTRWLLARLTGTTGLMAVSVALNFLLAWVVARFLGAEEAGRYFYLFTWMTLLSIVARQGYDRVVMRRIAVLALRADSEGMRKEWGAVLRRIAGVSLAIGLAVHLLAPVLNPWILGEADVRFALRILGIPLLLFAMLQNLGEALKGIHRVYSSVLLTGVVYPLSTLLVFLLIHHRVGGAMDHELALIALSLGLAGTLAVAWLMWRSYLGAMAMGGQVFGHAAGHAPGERSGMAPSAPDRGTGMSFSPRLFAASVSEYGLNVIPTLVLGFVVAAQDVAYFEIARRIAMTLSFFLVSLNGIVGPHFAARHSMGDLAGLQRLAVRSGTVLVLLSMPLIVLYMAAPGWLMGLFGEEFRAGGMYLQVLTVGQFVNLAAGSVGLLLVMTGHDREKFATTLWGLAGLAITLPWIHTACGGLGVAIAAAAAIILKNVSASWYVWRIFKVLPLSGLFGLRSLRARRDASADEPSTQ